MEISIQKCGDINKLRIGNVHLDNVDDYKIISSADGSTELIICIKLNAHTVKYDLSTN